MAIPENSTDILVFNKMVRMDDADKATNTMDLPFRFYPCFVAGLAYYLSMKKSQLTAQLKSIYEEEFRRAADEDEDRALESRHTHKEHMYYAKGKQAYGICDISGFRYKLKDMKRTWDGLLVGPDQWNEKHPQLEPRKHTADPEALFNPRPDQAEDVEQDLL